MYEIVIIYTHISYQWKQNEPYVQMHMKLLQYNYLQNGKNRFRSLPYTIHQNRFEGD